MKKIVPTLLVIVAFFFVGCSSMKNLPDARHKNVSFSVLKNSPFGTIIEYESKIQKPQEEEKDDAQD